jgi:hypothetical protein
LCPRIGREPLSQLIERAGYEPGHFVVNDGVNVGDLRLYHHILLVENERDSGLIGVVVLRGHY